MESLYVVLIILAGIIIYSAFNYFRQKKILKPLTEEEFKSGYRKAQLIDVREQKEYDGGHILGARNIPLSQLKMRLGEIRADKPVYIYCQNGMRSGRAAQLLHKKGVKDLYQLQGGFKKWTGKIKRK
ncbi:rhodanese-like domain-containing protein [Jeotgalibacillus salarius]|uniref:Rhodanese-like domain-containing protein n=1 Tax=Jeotgalibacillus salarius TaxID=546023 RepID=A0A4Y8L5G8_9BACL|nr:rhodanese-like domain-containing protein [Jeotgalibacillus salarius]TFD97537.1 rhodanese-like domain-containing protein [Jeotgalibacillus salarius]